MSNVGQKERAAQNRVVALFTDPQKLGYRYLGDGNHRAGNRNVEAKTVGEWLGKQGHDEALIKAPYFECDHCGCVDYCKYTEPHPHRATRVGLWSREEA